MVVTYNTSVDVYKLISGTKRDFSLSHSCKVFVEPARAEIVALYDGTPGGQLYKVFSENMSIDIGDKLVEGQKEYIVQGVEKYNSLIGKHVEIIARLGP